MFLTENNMESKSQSTEFVGESEQNGSASTSRPDWAAIVVAAFLFQIFGRVLETWMPYYLAMSISLCIVMIIAYPVREREKHEAFLKSCLKSILYSSLFGLGLFILSLLFPKSFLSR